MRDILQPPHHAPRGLKDEDEEYEKWRQRRDDEMSENSTKLCIDCAWFIVNGARCARAFNAPDYVRGYPATNRSAQVERVSDIDGACGPTAKHFKTIPVAA